MRHQPTERQILRTLWLRFQVELRLIMVGSLLSEALALATLRLRLRVAGGCWPRRRATPAGFVA
jgi:hypothetical protein